MERGFDDAAEPLDLPGVVLVPEGLHIPAGDGGAHVHLGKRVEDDVPPGNAEVVAIDVRFNPKALLDFELHPEPLVEALAKPLKNLLFGDLVGRVLHEVGGEGCADREAGLGVAQIDGLAGPKGGS